MTARFAPAAEPAVSAVLVTWGGLDWARKALDALARHTPEPFEAIVVDNASPDGLADTLEAEYEGLRVIRNAENCGFGPACNQGAAEARAPLVAFVNTDALVHEGWLPPLVEALARPGVVVAAGKLLHEDGSLQEAGALVSRSGWTVGYGDGDDPDDPAYAFPRFVDYVSAACMVVDRAAFGGAGGFDSAYAPAYYEDSDLCFRLAAAGGRVVYEPRSTVTHCRYGSGTSDLAHELSDRNRALFVSRFAGELVDRPRELNGRGALAARDARAYPRVLVAAPELEPGVEALAAALAGLLPDGRISVHLPEAPGDARDLLAAGVEVASGERAAWLEGRALHYDAVLATAADGRLEDELDATQPGAPRALGLDVQSLAADERRLRAVLAEVGVAPR